MVNNVLIFAHDGENWRKKMSEGKDVAVGISALLLSNALKEHGLTPWERFLGGVVNVAGYIYLLKKGIDSIFNRNKEASR